MFSDKDDYSEKCRMRRCHRRIQMRRQHHPKLLLSYLGQGIGEVAKKMESSSSREAVGAISIPGRQRVMEDTISIRPNLCLPEINQRQPIDFFAVYDGHGGRHVNPTVASMCKERMHEVLEEELMRMRNNVDMGGSSTSSPRGRRQPLEGQRMEEAWRKVFKSCFLKIDEMASCICSECGGVGYECGCPPSVLTPTGSTAVVVVLTDETIIVANCGDSRAVLSRSGSAIPLSYDHKPDKREERARIEACGGRVVFTDGARVEGVLSMSRAIGDNNLKPYMTSEPEMTFTKREADDECLILASDGLWDVISSDIACAVGRECLRHRDPAGDLSSRPSSVEGDSRGAMFSSRRACSAAALLTRLALGRNSCDNISVIVVDLKRNHTAV
ncbi:probable protein phosphatase 2C 75 [Solanum verrucosum]|uniref:probable protein phosphatase 2C 75 n=1 Tax=Solanum verrucosum TaxID=315347 RepID=UPI0020CFF042|nr:probable protein phosphatase 2C 75 [Solanum verrucosum]